MGQIVTQSLPANLLAVLTKTDSTTATGVLFSAVTCQFRREGEVAFTVKVLTALNFVEIGSGFYQIGFTAAELSLVGSFAYILTGVGLQQSSNEAQIRSVTSMLPTVPVALPTCELTGNISDLMGEPVIGAAVSARVVGMPTINGGVAVADTLSTAITDDNGVFFLTLVRTAVVDVFIPAANFRRQVTIPNQPSVDLFLGIP